MEKFLASSINKIEIRKIEDNLKLGLEKEVSPGKDQENSFDEITYTHNTQREKRDP